MRSVRRVLAIFLAGALALGAAVLSAPPASAATQLIKLDIESGTLSVGDLELPIAGEEGAASFLGVWNDVSGAITGGALSIEPQVIDLTELGFPGILLTVTMTQLGDAVSNINPTTGVGSLNVSMRVGITASILPPTCAIPSVTLNLTTADPGVPFTLDGTPQAGSLAGSGLSIPELSSTGADSCGLFAPTINDQLGLPLSDAAALLSVVAGDPPPAPPAPPTATAKPKNASATVSWTAPALTGDDLPLLGYKVTSSPGGKTCSSVLLTCTVTGLKNGTPYTFSVSAQNLAGFGPGKVTSPVTPFTVPGAPRSVKGAPLKKAVKVSWTAPTSNGGSPITGYTAIASPSGKTCTTTGALNCTITGLTPGKSYTFKAKAKNKAGFGALSAASAIVKPKS